MKTICSLIFKMIIFSQCSTESPRNINSAQNKGSDIFGTILLATTLLLGGGDGGGGGGGGGGVVA